MTIIQYVLEMLAVAIREEKETEGSRIAKEEIELSLFAEDTMIYLENPENQVKDNLK